jgi:hypothetical protein
VADGIFKAELNEFLTRELAEDGYSGVEVRVTPIRTEIIILATRTQNILGEKGRRIRELTSVVQKRFNFPEGTVEVRNHRLRIIDVQLGISAYDFAVLCITSCQHGFLASTFVRFSCGYDVSKAKRRTRNSPSCTSMT